MSEQSYEAGLDGGGDREVDDVEDQLQPEDSLDERGVDDVLDEGIVTREGWSPAQSFGNTQAEEAAGETLDQRLAQEVPDVEPGVWDEEDLDDDQVGDERAGRLVAPDEGAHGDDEQASLATDVGIDGAGATAEEAAMHVVPEE